MNTIDADKPEFIAVANCLRIVSHPSRLAIALLLLDGPCAVSEIESTLGLRQQNLSQHLGVLRDANLLTATRHAKSVVYELAEGTPRELVSAVSSAIRPSDALGRGKGHAMRGTRPEAKSAAPTHASASASAPQSQVSRTRRPRVRHRPSPTTG